MEWFWILWGIFSVITACVTFFLAAIDVIENSFAFILTVCVIIFPFGIFALVLTVYVVVFPIVIFIGIRDFIGKKIFIYFSDNKKK